VKKLALLAAAVAVVAALGGYFLARVMHPAASVHPQVVAVPVNPDSLVGEQRPDFVLKDTTGRQVSADEFSGRVLLINFWASWCKPCVEEMPLISSLYEELAGSGFSVVGIALDQPSRAAAFAAEIGVSYPVLVGETDTVMAGRRYGNHAGMLPYSVLVGADGIVRWTRLGAVSREDLERRVRELLPAAGSGDRPQS
jgi:peroxiredoxin